MRILFIPGIKTWEFYLKPWRKDLPKSFPKDEIVFLDDIFYIHFEKEKCEKIVEHGVNLLNDGKETIVLAHSFGGILGKTIISRAENHNVKRLVTLGSPHQMNLFGVKQTKNFLETPDTVNVPTVTYGGYFDNVVPYQWTNTDNSKHTNLWCTHIGFMLRAKVRARIISDLRLF
ncbi:MAG: hypothetical protein OEL89_01950 [Candidatus Peregrinibacteria bacterium]|nr:hypothetical protein [Candidatus Peregrinibacteria bacterium]